MIRNLFISVCLFFFIISFSSNSYSIDKTMYPPQVISIMNVKSSSYNPNDSTGPDNPDIFISSTGIKYHVIGRFTGRERPLSDTNKSIISMFSKARSAEYEKYYDREIEFIDSDQKTYWIPIQNLFYKAFKDEVKGNVVLYLIWIGRLKSDNCSVMNEFDAIN